MRAINRFDNPLERKQIADAAAQAAGRWAHDRVSQRAPEIARQQQAIARQQQAEEAQDRLVKIIVPRGNQRDVLAVETFFGALADEGAAFQPFALEIAATARERMFLVRGRSATVDLVLGQLRLAYPQCEFEDVPPEEDPAGPPEGAGVRVSFELRLREPAYLPIRTHVSREGRVTNNDFGSLMADPMIAVLSGMSDDLGGGAERERCLIQFIPRPMPDDWSKYWRGGAGDVGERAKVTPTQMAITLLSALGPMSIGFGLLMTALAVLGQGLGMALLAALFILGGVGMIYWRFRLPSAPDALLVKQKVSQAAFRVWARVFITADSAARAYARADRVKAALRGYNMAGANGFVFVELPPDLRPQTLDFSGDPFLENLPFLGLVRPPKAQMPILNVSEMAVLWHLPHSESGLQGVAYTSSRRILPLPRAVAKGTLIGHSEMQGQRVDVRLPPFALRGNIGLVAKTQSG
ncbi:MAG: hypothetical protein ACUVSX_15220, partial [Aggregatilineales bacterium]